MIYKNQSTQKLYSLLHNEHMLIEAQLEKLQSSNKEQKELIIWLRTNAIQKHNFNEETLLFPILLNKKRLHEGGPFCVMFFDEHILNKPSDTVKKITGYEISYSNHQEIFRNNKSPLDIPLEEHQTCEALLHFIENTTPQGSQYQKAISALQSQFLKHHQKEERCFIHLCDNLLTEQEIEHVLSRWQPISI